MNLPFYSNCVGWPGDIQSLHDIIDRAREITRRTFLKHVNQDTLKEIEQGLGHERHGNAGLTMASDWHVGYFKSILRGKPAYYFIHSAIEYVFMEA